MVDEVLLYLALDTISFHLNRFNTITLFKIIYRKT